MRNTSLGMGYRFSEINRKISSASDSNIVTRLASRSITGHELPIQIHQHYGLEFHFILNNKHCGTDETCMSRGIAEYCSVRKFCPQLERSALQGLCSCIFDNRRNLSMSNKVEQCFRARPIERPIVIYPDMYTEDEIEFTRWLDKAHQQCVKIQRDVCCCRPSNNPSVWMD